MAEEQASDSGGKLLTETAQTLIITVNSKEIGVPADFGSTPREFLDALAGWEQNREWDVYRVDGPSKLDESDLCTEPMVVSEGDEFVVVPRYVGGA